MKIAVARPAAPAPTIATSAELKRGVYAALLAPSTNDWASLTGTVEIAPHALQRTVRWVESSSFPMISVRWLPHFGQTGGVVGRGMTSSFVVKWTMMSYRVPIIGPTFAP